MIVWLWIIFGSALVVGLGLFIYFTFIAVDDEEEVDEEFTGDDTLPMGLEGGDQTLSETLATTTEEYRSARKSRMLALKESLEASLETRHGTESASTKDRMSMPWFMLVGTDGSGKTTLLANTGLPLPYGPAFEVDSKKKDAGRWWLYEDAVVLEAPPASPGATATGTTLGPDQTSVANTSEGWNTLLHMLRRERPDSPLNGIIVTVSVGDLIEWRRDPMKCADHAERIRTFLERTRRVLGVRLPVHVLVTKADMLPGFRSFADNLPPERRHDILGWANPNRLEAAFNADWVDLGIAAMKERLEDVRDELLAAPDELVDPDGLFVFVNEFAELHEPLKDFVTQVIREERRPLVFFRGMYFCGDAMEVVHHDAPDAQDARRSGERSTVRISSEAALADANPHNLVFVRSLFRDRIFREAGLARPMSQLHLSRDRRVLLAQAAAIGIAVVGGGGLWTTLNGFARGDTYSRGLVEHAEHVSGVLAGIAVDLDEVNRGVPGTDSVTERRRRDAAVIDLVARMRDVVPIRKSAFIPASWFSPLPGDVHRSMITGIEAIVLPLTRERLLERLNVLLTPGAFSAVARDADDPRAVIPYLREVRAIGREVARFNAIAATDTGSIAHLGALLEYAYGERPLPEDTLQLSAEFVEAVRLARSPPIELTDAMQQVVVARSVGAVMTAARRAAMQLAPRASAEAEATVSPAADIEALRDLHLLVQLSDDSTGIVAALADSLILGMPLTAIVRDSIVAQLQYAARVIGRDQISAEDAERRLRSVLQTLFSLPLMDTIASRDVAADIAPGQRLRWDVGRLELALSLRGDYQQALATVAAAFQGRPMERMQRAFQVQLRARAQDAAASAQRFTPLTIEAPTAELRAAIENLDLASPRIDRVAQLLDTLGLAEQGRRLRESGARQAEQALALAMRTLRDGHYFEPNTAKMAAWLGVQPLSFAAMDVPDSIELTRKLVNHVNGPYLLLPDVDKALKYLEQPGLDSTRVPRLVEEWRAISASVRGYQQADPNSTLLQLFRYARDRMGIRDVESCRAMLAEPDSVPATRDIFVTRRLQLRAAMIGRCYGASDAIARYDRVRFLFASRLGGRFPFTEASAANLPDADPVAIREFYRAYDAFVADGWELMLRTDPRIVESPASADVFTFLDRVRDARAFLSPMLDDERRAPTYGVLLGERPLTWTFGQSLIARATDPDSLDRAVQGGWSALRYAVSPSPAHEPITFHHPQYKLPLTLPTFPSQAPILSVR